MHQHSSIAILALGDRSYPHFCRAGAIFDNLLPGNRLLPRVDINQEDWPRIKNWMQNIESALADAMSTAPPSHLPDYLTGSINKYAASTCHVDVRYTRRNPFLASITLRQDLTVAMSPVSDPKEVVRIQFDISGSDMRYQVGDALCVVPRNNPDHVTRLLLSLASNGDEMVRINDYSDPVQFEIALTEALDISTIKPELVATLARRCDQAIEYDLGVKILGYDVRMENGVGVSAFGKAYLEEREVFDILSDFVSASISAHELVKVLRPLHARYYSISSTPVTSPNAIDITVDVLRYSSLDVERQGVSSTFLKDRCRVNDTKVALFITKNPNFRLPNDLCRPIIMIGPGTGVAPFVAFVEERIARDATGENVLFFGCRHAKQDFLYRERLLQYNDMGHLQLHTAFSRDSAKKIYVQQRILEHGEQLWSLIHDKSAHIYVCGDGGNMARDVDATLCNIIMQYGCMNKEDADNFIANLSNSKRYQRDVWVS